MLHEKKKKKKKKAPGGGGGGWRMREHPLSITIYEI
jgi:hypothetical protein